jgi:hypothetical protein
MRLVTALHPAAGTVVPIVCDSFPVVDQVLKAIAGRGFAPAAFECADQALFSEVIRLGQQLPVTVIHRDHSALAKNVTAAGRLESVAHRVAWTMTRLLRDGLDPAAEWDLLSWAAKNPARRQESLTRNYRAWRNGTPAQGQPPVSARSPRSARAPDR